MRFFGDFAALLRKNAAITGYQLIVDRIFDVPYINMCSFAKLLSHITFDVLQLQCNLPDNYPR